MIQDWLAVTAIVAMAAATYATRAAGLGVMSRITVTPRLEAFLRHMPGAILTAILAAGVSPDRPGDLAATLVTGVVAAKTRNLLLALAAGVGCAVILRR